mmetsp:Transcript_51309/g.115605  ORF Transcript_51309/g.115605 Transcript_51309/m.115605 type:complete len:236 (-) Transcript_51309:34-741(-)
MTKVNWMARPNEAIANYKILQQAFDRCKLEKVVEGDKLARGKYQDNLEMLQWIRSYFVKVRPQAGYDGPSRRFGELPEWARPAGSPKPIDTAASPKSPAIGKQARKMVSSGPSTPMTPPRPPRKVDGSKAVKVAWQDKQHAHEGNDSSTESVEDREKLLQDLRHMYFLAKGLESERDFYFQKLFNIETLANTWADSPAKEELQSILYEDAEDPDESVKRTLASEFGDDSAHAEEQ